MIRINWKRIFKRRLRQAAAFCLLTGFIGLAGGYGTAKDLIGPSIAGAAAAVSGNTGVFKDIRGHWALEEIESMVAQGILNGYPDGTFRPNEPVQVDQFIKMLILSYSEQHPNLERTWRASFLESLSEENRTILKQDYRYFDFKPAMTGYWAKPYIDVASDLNFLNKSRYSDFQTGMTRENVAEVLYYTLQETEFLEDEQFSRTVAASYGDLTSASDRQQKFIAESLIKGIMQGYPDGNFGVGRTVSRAEALVILNRLTDKTKRIPIQPEEGKLQRLVPTPAGDNESSLFPTNGCGMPMIRYGRLGSCAAPITIYSIPRCACSRTKRRKRRCSKPRLREEPVHPAERRRRKRRSGSIRRTTRTELRSGFGKERWPGIRNRSSCLPINCSPTTPSRSAAGSTRFAPRSKPVGR